MEDLDKLLSQQQSQLLQRISYIIVLTCCLITFSHGLSVLFGKNIPYAFLSKLDSSENFMVYDTAFSFCVASIGILGVIYQKKYLTTAAIYFLILMSIITIVQYLTNNEWNITGRLFYPLLNLEMERPGRMRPLTPFCFLLFSMMLMQLMNVAYRSNFKLVYACTQGIIILCLAILFLFGYTLDIYHDNFKNSITLMTAHASVGFLFLSLASIFTVIYLDKERPSEFRKTIPLLISAFITIASLLSLRLMNSRVGVLELVSKINWINTAHELILSFLIGTAVYYFQKNYLYGKSFKTLYARAKATLEAAHDGILVLNSYGNIVDYNQRLLNLWSLNSDEILNQNYPKFFNLISAELKEPDNNLNKFFDFQKQNVQQTCELKLKNGNTFEFYAYPQKYGKKIIGYVFSFYDITHLKVVEEKLTYQATHDVLTNLANRFLLFDHIEQSIARAKREKKIFAILFVDLDFFKMINDSLSHVVGDKVLKAVATRLLSCTRTEDTLARIGGDEFVLLAVDLKSLNDAAVIARKFIQVLTPPFYIDRHELYIRCSIGISIYPSDAEDANNLVKYADIAMYIAKKKQDHVQFYTHSMHKHISTRLQLENELPRALEKQQFEVYYQPIVDMASHKVCDTEALIRWNHPTLGLLLPSEFITAAEDTGIISAIGQWVLETVCKQNKEWQNKKILNTIISVNISIKQLHLQDFVAMISSILEKSQLSPEYLQLELTESRSIDNIEHVGQVLNDLKKIGIKIAIDDFGTGYTGLSYIKYFPLDKLKIDKSLIANILNNSVDKALVDTIIDMCRNLNINSCVEGVETKEQYQYLHDKQCNQAQGFYFSRPLNRQDYENFILNFS